MSDYNANDETKENEQVVNIELLDFARSLRGL